MQTRLDYVTNSSSASFIMYIESSSSNLDDFKNDMQKFVDDYIKTFHWRFTFQDNQIREKYKTWIEEATSEQTKNHYIEALKEYDSDDNPSREAIIKSSINTTASQISTNVFSIEDFTSMLNDLVDDLPHYMQHLIMLHITGEAYKYGIKNIKLKVIDDH